MQVGFIPQLKGTLTNKRYTTATIFVDHYSKLKYIHLMTKLTSEEMMEAKRTFKYFAKQHGVRILHYNCDNGQFADNAFKNSCSPKGQHLTTTSQCSFWAFLAKKQTSSVLFPPQTTKPPHMLICSIYL